MEKLEIKNGKFELIVNKVGKGMVAITSTKIFSGIHIGETNNLKKDQARQLRDWLNQYLGE